MVSGGSSTMHHGEWWDLLLQFREDFHQMLISYVFFRSGFSDTFLKSCFLLLKYD